MVLPLFYLSHVRIVPMPLLSPDYQELVRLILAKAITASAARQLMMQGCSARQIVRSVLVPPIA